MLCIHLVVFHGDCQVLIHAHNDYEKPDPLFTALRYKVYSLEADVLFRNGKLFVAHSTDKIDSTRTIQSLYLNPIDSLFKKNRGYISPEKDYLVTLMIDVKDSGKESIEALIKIIEPIKKYFDRSLNQSAVRIVISGDRGPIDDWIKYPGYILFDGRFSETYSPQVLTRVAFMSENFWNYVSVTNQENWSRLNEAIQKAHALKKPVRFWATPDSEKTWTRLHESGVDIINTDRVQECSEFLNKPQTLTHKPE